MNRNRELVTVNKEQKPSLPLRTLCPLCLRNLFEKCHRLHACYLETFAASDVLAGDHIVFADHIRACLGEFCAIAFVGAGRKLTLFCAYQPGELVLGSLPAVRTTERVRPSLLLFVKHFALFHQSSRRAYQWIIA